MNDNDNVVGFPAWAVKSFKGLPQEALEAAKGWDFEEVIIVGLTRAAIDGESQGGSAEGTIICSSSNSAAQTSRNLAFMASLCNYLALKQLGFD